MFCEQCGSRLSSGVRFCENCGAPVSVEKEQIVEEASGFVEGLIFTNISKLASYFSCAEVAVKDTLEKFIVAAKVRGVNYRIYNDASNSLSDCISSIKKELQAKSFKYLFLIGDYSIVPCREYRNRSQDSDAVVPSDLPYSILDSMSDPFDGITIDFDSCIKVGRLPVYSGEDFSGFENYLSNANLFSGNIESYGTFGTSALVWEETSKKVYSNVKNGSLYTSPNLTAFDIGSYINDDASLLYFNLHGSNTEKYWYGQEGYNYPEAFSPDGANGIRHPYFCAVEACYGAKFDNYRKSDSITLMALTTKCLGLFGSSMIAYGTAYPPGSCADVIVGEYMNNLSSGMSSGDAAAFARKKFFSDNLDDAEIKTLCEFDFFGDPSVHLKGSCNDEVKQAGTKSYDGRSRLHGIGNLDSAGSLRIAMPDVQKAVRASIAAVNQKIQDAINQHVEQTYPYMKGIKPVSYRMSYGIKSEYQNVYQKNDGKINQVVKIYFDNNGKITKEYISK